MQRRLQSGWSKKKQKQPHVDIVVILDSNTPQIPHGRAVGKSAFASCSEKWNRRLCANLFSTAFDKRETASSSDELSPAPSRCGRGKTGSKIRIAGRHYTNVEDHRKNLIIDGDAPQL